MNTISEKNYLSSKDAGAILGYTHDYVSRLCRQGKMSGIQKGREWFVTQEEIDAFKMRHEVELAEKKKELSKKFSHIRKEAEAKKRKAREQATQFVSESVHIKRQSDLGENTEIKQVTFKFPKQLAAALALFICIMIPSFISSPATKNSLQNFTNSFEKRETASIFEASTALSWNSKLFLSSISTLPQHTYLSLRSIGEGYLILYLAQGAALSYSFENLSSIGAVVIVGYELVGESFWQGGKDIIKRFNDFFSTSMIFKSIAYFPKNYVANVSGGLEYIKQDADQNIFGALYLGIADTSKQIHSNIAVNLYSIGDTLSFVSQGATAYVGSLFEFNLIEKEEKIKAIKLEK
jgi:hypothetical protein